MSVEPIKLNGPVAATAAPERKSGAPLAGGIVTGAGFMAVAMSMLQGNPTLASDVVHGVMQWGPALLILAGLWKLADKHAVPLVHAITEGSIALHRSASVAEQSRDHEISTTMALNTLARKVDDLTEAVRGLK